MTENDTPLAVRLREEVERLHVFFEDWMSGRALRLPTVFATFTDATDPAFTMVNPRGLRHSGRDVGAWIEKAHGVRGADFRIWITDCVVLNVLGSLVLASYVEHQTINGADTARLATALFRCDGARLTWLSVHETWIEGRGPP